MNSQNLYKIILCIWLLLTSSVTKTDTCRESFNASLGKASASTRIIGGVTVAKNSRPYQLALMIQRKNSGSRTMCGAVLIAPDLALTAAHCTTKYSLNQYDFVLSSGKHELFKNEISQQDRHAEKVYTHPHYFTSSDSELNDISLLKFQPFELDPSTQPIQLPGVDFKIDMSINPKGIITGWGCTYEGCNGAVSPFLQEVHVPILENSDCKKAYPSIRDSMICAAEAEGGKDSCQGDSGGPMVLEEDSQKTLIGLVSWGIGCACKGYPGVYTRVTSYLKWIQDGIDNKIEPDTTQPPPGENTPDHNEREENNSNIFQPDVWATAEAYLVICILAMLF